MATHLRPSHWASWPDAAARPLTGADVAHNTSSPREPDRHPPSGPRQRIPELPLPLRYTNVSIESFIHPSRRFYSCAFLSDCRISPYHIPAVARRTLAIKDLFTPDKAAKHNNRFAPAALPRNSTPFGLETANTGDRILEIRIPQHCSSSTASVAATAFQRILSGPSAHRRPDGAPRWTVSRWVQHVLLEHIVRRRWDLGLESQ